MLQKGPIAFIIRVVYPKYHPIWFVIYMYFKYYSVLKRHKRYSVEVLPDNVLWRFLQESSRSCWDINNCVLVNPKNLYPCDRTLDLLDCQSGKLHKVVVISDNLCAADTLYLSSTLFAHLQSRKNLRLIKRTPLVGYGSEIQLALISNPDISTSAINHVIEGYFCLPKLVKSGDIIPINIKYFAEPLSYTNPRCASLERLYFKCIKLAIEGKPVYTEQYCVIGETAILQVPNVQSFVPKIDVVGTRASEKGVKLLSNVRACPYGLHGYFDKLEAAVSPFLNTSNLPLRPAFLLQGDQGCGYDTLISSLSAHLGMQHIRINNCDLSANIYAQNESKLNNAFFSAKMSAPCILSIYKFENFGKNNEGQYDDRLINSFANQMSKLFDKNEFPVILFCFSTSKEIPAELKRVFLEVFDIDAPSDSEREWILKWVLEKHNITYDNLCLKAVANKTHGFYFEDLKALVYYAEGNFYNRKNKEWCDVISLNEEDFDKAIDYMQANYNESLGAPKVPKVEWSDVGGLTEVKEEIIKTINLPLKHPTLFENSGLTRSGILLFGPPGTGKTLIAKAVATECSLCFLTVKGPELLNMYVGQSEQNVREVFERARQASPCIIFFDELDSLAPNRGLSGDSGGVMDRVVSQLLAEMDGLSSGGKVFVIGATNRPDLIDPALLRPGRFDKLLYVGPCTDVESKVSVLAALTRKFRLPKDLDLRKIVVKSPNNITGADFYGICSDAWSSAAKRLIDRIENEGQNVEAFTHEDVMVEERDFVAAIKNVKPSLSEQDLKYFEHLKKELSSIL